MFFLFPIFFAVLAYFSGNGILIFFGLDFKAIKWIVSGVVLIICFVFTLSSISNISIEDRKKPPKILRFLYFILGVFFVIGCPIISGKGQFLDSLNLPAGTLAGTVVRTVLYLVSGMLFRFGLILCTNEKFIWESGSSASSDSKSNNKSNSVSKNNKNDWEIGNVALQGGNLTVFDTNGRIRHRLSGLGSNEKYELAGFTSSTLTLRGRYTTVIYDKNLKVRSRLSGGGPR